MATVIFLSEIIKFGSIPEKYRNGTVYVLCDQKDVPISIAKVIYEECKAELIEMPDKSPFTAGIVIGQLYERSGKMLTIVGSNDTYKKATTSFEGLIYESFGKTRSVSVRKTKKTEVQVEEDPLPSPAAENKETVKEEKPAKKRGRKTANNKATKEEALPLKDDAMNPPAAEDIDPLAADEFEMSQVVPEKKTRRTSKAAGNIPAKFQKLLDGTKIEEISKKAGRDYAEISEKILEAVREVNESVSLEIRLRIKILDAVLSDSICKQLEKGFKELKKASKG